MLYELACQGCNASILAKRKDRKYCDACRKLRNNACSAAWRIANPEQARLCVKVSRERALDSGKDGYGTSRVYGLTDTQLRAMVEAQNGVCAICGGVNADGKRLYVDHDNACCSRGKNINRRKTCGKCTRGLLCRQCNIGLGGFRDNPELLVKAIQYLAKFTEA